MQARKATFLLKKNVKNMYRNHKTLLFLFDCYIGPIVNYGSEIWGTRKSLNVERIHLDFCKHILGVKKSTCTAAVYAELGKVSFTLPQKIRIIFKYWRKLIYSNNCILLNCYDKLFDDVENHKKINWVSDVKNCLIDLGFNEIWNAQRCNEGTLCVIKQRIFDQAKQRNFCMY